MENQTAPGAQDQRSFGGIDPGKDGCLAVIRPSGDVEFHDVPTAWVEKTTKTKAGNKKQHRVYLPIEMLRMVRDARVDHFTIEKVQPMPAIRGGMVRQGAVYAFASGEGWGLWQMLLAVCSVEGERTSTYQAVHSSHWKSVLMHGEPKTKEAVIPFAQRLYPKAAGMLRGPKGALLIDRADALLLAHFGKLGLR